MGIIPIKINGKAKIRARKRDTFVARFSLSVRDTTAISMKIINRVVPNMSEIVLVGIITQIFAPSYRSISNTSF